MEKTRRAFLEDLIKFAGAVALGSAVPGCGGGGGGGTPPTPNNPAPQPTPTSSMGEHTLDDFLADSTAVQDVVNTYINGDAFYQQIGLTTFGIDNENDPSNLSIRKTVAALKKTLDGDAWSDDYNVILLNGADYASARTSLLGQLSVGDQLTSDPAVGGRHFTALVQDAGGTSRPTFYLNTDGLSGYDVVETVIEAFGRDTVTDHAASVPAGTSASVASGTQMAGLSNNQKAVAVYTAALKAFASKYVPDQNQSMPNDPQTQNAKNEVDVYETPTTVLQLGCNLYGWLRSLQDHDETMGYRQVNTDADVLAIFADAGNTQNIADSLTGSDMETKLSQLATEFAANGESAAYLLAANNFMKHDVYNARVNH